MTYCCCCQEVRDLADAHQKRLSELQAERPLDQFNSAVGEVSRGVQLPGWIIPQQEPGTGGSKLKLNADTAALKRKAAGQSTAAESQKKVKGGGQAAPPGAKQRTAHLSSGAPLLDKCRQ